MLFQGPVFLVFLLLVWLALDRASGRPRLRLWLLGLFSLAFYLSWGWAPAALLCLISYISYRAARQGRWARRCAILLNVLNLVTFRYVLTKWVGDTHAWEAIFPAGPVGISFYTFELIAYLVDVDHGRQQAATSYLRFWNFVSFFPHLLAGPIVRPQSLLEQMDEQHVRPADWSAGLGRLALGILKKSLLAESIGPSVAFAFRGINGLHPWWAAALFGFQIYFDFSGYSDMAIGMAQILGFSLPENFRTPYLSLSIAEFWQRWHITLSTWIRDYIYFPLGGLRRGSIYVARNLLIAMTLCGLWHGPSWRFAAWGCLHGIFLAVQRLFQRWRGPTPVIRGWGRFWRWGLTYLAVTLSWILFRAPSGHQAWQLFSHLLPHRSDLSISRTLLIGALFGLQWGESRMMRWQWRNRWESFSPILQGSAVALGLVIWIVLSAHPTRFEYFDF